MSRTGDEAVDLPSASAGIVFWNNWQSRRQIVQRIGRLARPHAGPPPVFLILHADDEKEKAISKHREKYMVEHGFVIKSVAYNTLPYGVQELRPGEKYVKQVIQAWNTRRIDRVVKV